jgi:hypothetical protein
MIITLRQYKKYDYFIAVNLIFFFVPVFLCLRYFTGNYEMFDSG